MRKLMKMIGSYPTFLTDAVPPCAKEDPDIYFPEGRARRSPETVRAKKSCSACVSKVECREWASTNRLPGIWGETTERERYLMRKERKTLAKLAA